MSKQVISLGTAPTGVGGDTPRSAFLKAQANFDELYNAFYAAKGANSDITSLLGLTTALSAAQGGTGVTSLAALLTALNGIGNYARSNILGTVSQASGVPSGAIIERGSNANGVYVKFADGTMDVYRVVSLGTVAITSAIGTEFASAAQGGWAFPATFARCDNFSCTVVSSNAAVTEGTAAGPATTGWGAMYMLCPASSSPTISLYLKASGVWFT